MMMPNNKHEVNRCCRLCTAATMHDVHRKPVHPGVERMVLLEEKNLRRAEQKRRMILLKVRT